MATDTEGPTLVDDATVGQFARAAVIAALMGASVVVSIPVGPVSMTIQTLFVFLAGLLLGPKWGMLSMGIYVAAGAAGVPIFSDMTGGVGALFDHTGGYLLGFILAAGLIGGLVHRGSEPRSADQVSLPLVASACILGLALIYTLGVVRMMQVLEFELYEALAAGVAPFVISDGLAIIVAIAVFRSDRIAERQP